MIAPKDSPGFDVKDLVQRRVFYESLRGQMNTELASWLPHWSQLAAFFLPRSQKIGDPQPNQGSRMDYSIINETGGIALRVVASGMLNGMSGPTRAWFRFVLLDDALNEQPEVRQWCEAVEDTMRRALLRSNFYQTLLTFYKEQALYGTSAFLIEQDREPDPRKNTIFRCRPYPIGSYMLGLDDQLRPDLSMRIIPMKIRDEVAAFGYDRLSASTRQLNDTSSGGVKETWRKVVHVIHRASYFGEQAQRITRMPWISSHYELDSYDPDNAIIDTKGYWENPLVVGRWNVEGENVYGDSPAMEVLGSVMSLQAYEDRLAQGVEKLINPPMVAASSVDPRRLTTLPGEITFTDAEDASKVFAPTYQIKYDQGAVVTREQIERLERRINDGMYRSVFQAITDMDRRQITAQEIRARQAEQMQVLGPVVERNVEEGLSPAVTRCFGIMYRAGKFPPMPKVMHHQPMAIAFQSILASAQRMERINNIAQWFGIIGNEAAVEQGTLDNADLDEGVRELGRLFEVPNKLIRTKEQVDAIRADKARQAQMAQNAENAKNLAAAAQNLANAPTNDGTSLLDKVMPTLAGGHP